MAHFRPKTFTQLSNFAFVLLNVILLSSFLTTSSASPLDGTMSYMRRDPSTFPSRNPSGGSTQPIFLRELNSFAASHSNNGVLLNATQASASDGSGTGFDAPATIWIVFAFLVGLPMTFAGYRGYRITNGVAVGLTFCVTCE